MAKHNPDSKNFVRVCAQRGIVFESMRVLPGSIMGRWYDGKEPVFFVYMKKRGEKNKSTLAVKVHKRSWSTAWNTSLLGMDHPISKMILSVLPKKQVLDSWKDPYSCKGLTPHERRIGRYDIKATCQLQIDGRGWDESWTENWVPRYDGMRCTYNEAMGSTIPVTDFEGITDCESALRRDHMKIEQHKIRPEKKKPVKVVRAIVVSASGERREVKL